MPTRIIRQPEHIDALADLLRGLKLPVTVSWEKGAPRRNAQNRLSFRWYQDIARHFGDRTVEEVRATCKVRQGMPILSRDSEPMHMSFKNAFGGRTYEEIIKIVEDLQIPVTSLMTVKQMSEYLNEVEREYRAQGVYLTDPEALRWEQEFSKMEGN